MKLKKQRERRKALNNLKKKNQYPKFNSSFKLANLMVTFGLRNRDVNDGNYKKLFNGVEQLPRNGFVRAKAASNRSDGAGLFSVNESPLKRNPKEASSGGDWGYELSEVTG